MKTANGKHIMAVALLLILGMLVSACAAKLNPGFQGSLASALNAKKGDFKGCYERALQNNREVKGDMNLLLQFVPNSRQVDIARVVQTNIVDEQMKQCVCDAAKGVTTTNSPGVHVDARYTVNFDFE